MKVQDRKQDLILDLEEMKKLQFEEMFLITSYSLEGYFKSLFTFGIKSKITKDNLNIIKEMFSILMKERKMLNYILANLDSFNLSAVANVIGIIDDVNDKTVRYYYNVMQEITDACEAKDELRGNRPSKDFPTLIQSDSYTNEVIALALNKSSIKDFLGYEDKFWKFIENKDITNIKVCYEIAKDATYVIPLYDEFGIVSDIKMMIPEVVDLETALLCIQQYQKAYEIFKSLGSRYETKDNSEVLEKLHIKFQNSYLPRKTKIKMGIKNVK